MSVMEESTTARVTSNTAGVSSNAGVAGVTSDITCNTIRVFVRAGKHWTFLVDYKGQQTNLGINERKFNSYISPKTPSRLCQTANYSICHCGFIMGTRQILTTQRIALVLKNIKWTSEEVAIVGAEALNG